MQNDYINIINFKAKPGNRLLKQVTKEFNGDKMRVNKYIKLFEDTFENVTDKNTIIDIDKDKNYIFSNIKFPNIKYCYTSNLVSVKLISQKLINECSKTISNGELMLFRNIISKIHSKDKSLKCIEERTKTEKFSKKFKEQLGLAEKILEKNPHSKLTSVEFDAVDMEIVKENLKDIVNKIFKPEDFSF